MVAMMKLPRVAERSTGVPHMRLVTDESTGSGAERRMFPRKSVSLEARGRRLDHSISARRSPFLSWSVRDLSAGGLSAITSNPINPGERVNVTIPDNGFQQGWDALGRVIRCEMSSMGYRVAVEFDRVPLAA